MDSDDDPMLRAVERSSIAQTLKAARASLSKPSRPYTPLDRSLFQQPDAASPSRPSSSYSVDQLNFVVRDFGGPSDSVQSSRSSRTGSRPDTIQEEDYRREGGADVLRLERRPSKSSHGSPEVADDSDREELTPMTVFGSAPSPPPKMPFRPPRPPSGSAGYPAVPSASSSNFHTRGNVGDAPCGFGLPCADPSQKHKVSSPLPNRKTSADLGGCPTTDDPSRRRRSSPSPSSKQGRKTAWVEEADVILAKMRDLSISKDLRREDPDAVMRLCSAIWTLAADVQQSKGSDQSRIARKLLREVMNLMDLQDMKDPKFIFRLSRSALALLRVSGATDGFPLSGVQQAYLNISQGLFKYSQKDEYDKHFIEEELIEPLIEVLASDTPEFVSNDLRVYVAGVLKNVSHDEENQKFIADRGAITTLFRLLRNDDLSGTAKEAQLLIQVTAALRNFAGNYPDQFLSEDRLDLITRVMTLFPNHTELLTNVSRILAKLTVDPSACEAFARNAVHVREIAKTLGNNIESTPLTLRMAFVLGNLTELSDRLRVIFAFDCEGTTLVPQLLAKYWQKERELVRLGTGKAKDGIKDIDEVLVKLVRLIANIAISATVGSTLASSSAVADPLMDILGAKHIKDSEELILNVVAAITNLLFYDEPSNLFFQEDNKPLLCRLFRPLLNEGCNVEALIETARALGNLSRHADARKCMATLRVDEMLVRLLDQDERDLVFPVCGALVNLGADPECTFRLMSTAGITRKLVDLLNDAPTDDLSLRLVATKVLTNLSLDASIRWPSSDVGNVRSILERIPSDLEKVTVDLNDEVAKTEVQQLLELSSRLMQRLPVFDANSTASSVQALARSTGTGSEDAARSDVSASLPSSEKPVVAGDVSLRPEAAQEVISGDTPTDKTVASEWACQFEGCTRRFVTEAKMLAHVQRRHVCAG